MRRIVVAAVAAWMVLLVPGVGPAWADHERSRCGGGYESGDSYGCDEYGGQGNNNRRREDYEGAGCKYVCPSFERSPVHDAFNFAPFICMPGATCYEDGDKRPGQDGSGGGQSGQDPPRS